MKLIRFLVFSNCWVAAGASFLTLLTFKFLDTQPDYKLVWFVFFSTLFSYNFQRIARLSSFTKLAPTHWINSHHKEAKVILVISLLGALISTPIFDKPYLLLLLVFLGIISIGYSYKKLRDIPMLKIFLIAASWGILCGLTPFFYSPQWGSVSWAQSFFWIFFYILAITIPFDIRDLPIDEENKNTLPQLLGIKGSKLLALLFLCSSFLCLITFNSAHQSILFFVSFLFAGGLILQSFPSKRPLYFGLFVDGHIILQFLIVYFLG